MRILQRLRIQLLLAITASLFPWFVSGEPSRGLNVEPASRPAIDGQAPLLPNVPAPPTNPRWTLLIYMAADNNLEPFAIQDINELERGLWLIEQNALDPTLVDILVLVDRAEGYSRAWGDWTDTRLIRIKPDNSPAFASQTLVQNLELNMGDPETLKAFINAATHLGDSEYSALILWNHGGGWSNLAHDEATPAAEFGYLRLQDLAAALEEVSSNGANTSFDLIGFDMCLMAQFETAASIKDHADVMVASQALEPGDGWPYAEVVPTLALADGRDSAIAIVDAFHDYYQSRNEPDTTLAAIDLTKMEEFERALAGLLDKHAVELPTLWRNWTQGVFTAESYALLDDEASGQEALQSIDLYDLLDYLSQERTSRELSQSLETLKHKLKALVIENRTSPRRANSHGLAIYAPLREPLFNPSYIALEPAGTEVWQQLLQQMYSGQRQSDPYLIFRDTQTWSALRDEPVPNIQQLGQDGILAKLDTRNALKLETWMGRPRPGGEIEILDQRVAQFFGPRANTYQAIDRSRNESLKGYLIPEGRVEVFTRLDGIGYTVTNGVNEADLTLSQTALVAAERGEFEAKITYIPSGSDQTFEGVLRFNWLLETESVAIRVPSPTGVISYQRIYPSLDDQITFYLQILGTGGTRFEPTKTLRWRDGLILKVNRLPLGNYVQILDLEDLLGRHKQAAHPFVLTANPALADFLNQAVGEPPVADQFEGEWQIFDATSWFQQGQLVPTGVRVHYTTANDAGLMIKTTTTTEGKATLEEAWLSGGALPQLREVVINEEGDIVDLRQVAIGVPAFFRSRGFELIASYDLSTGSLSVKGRTLRQTEQISSAVEQPNNKDAATGITPLEGIWQAENGTLFIVRGTEWAITAGQQLVDQGTLLIAGTQLFLASQGTGANLEYRFELEGSNLNATDQWGQKFHYQRISE